MGYGIALMTGRSKAATFAPALTQPILWRSGYGYL